MVEINNSKKNIIILFLSMSFFLFFIYKGFFADSSHYLREYKNYLIRINASKYYFDKLEKNKIIKEDKSNINKNKEFHELLLKIKHFINYYININEIIIEKLENNEYLSLVKLKRLLNDALKYLKQINKNNSDLLEVIEKYNKT